MVNVSYTRIGRSRGALGFTLIELLVTISLFAAAVGVLVVGLRAGIRSWRSVRNHQVSLAEFVRAFDRFSEDVRHATTAGKDIPVIQETSAGENEDILSITTLGSRRMQRVGIKADWARVEYRVAALDEATGKGLVRSAQAMAGGGPVGPPQEETLLSDVDTLRFDYGTGQEVVPVWENGETVPMFIRITLQGPHRASVTRTVLLPAGAFARSAQ